MAHPCVFFRLLSRSRFSGSSHPSSDITARSQLPALRFDCDSHPSRSGRHVLRNHSGARRLGLTLFFSRPLASTNNKVYVSFTPHKYTMSFGTATAAADDELIYDMFSMLRAYRSGRVERFEPFEFVPPSIDPVTGVDSEDIVLNPTTGVSVRLYRPPSVSAEGKQKPPILVFYHGGGFCLHRPSSAPYHNYLNYLTSKANIVAVSVDYRLAPEHPLPAAYEDSWEALQWVIGGGGNWDRDRIILAGDSAGGNIVHYLGMRLGREGKKVEGMVLLNPYFWGKERIGVELEERDGSLLTLKVVDQAWEFLCPETTGSDDPRLNPVAEGAPSLASLGCKRVLVSGGDMDLLIDRGRIYCQKLQESGWGGEVELVVAEGGDHGFFLHYPGNEKAEAFMDRFVSFCNSK